MLRIAWSIHRRSLTLAGAALFLVGVLAVVLRSGAPSSVAPAPLGNIAASRAEPTAPVPLTAAAPVIRPAAPADPGAGPARPGAERSLLVTRLPDAEYHAAAMAAIRCATTVHRDGASSVTALAHDTTLDAAAADLWRATVAAPEMELATVAGNRFAYVAAVPLSLATGAESAAASGACDFGGMDFGQLDLSGLSAVGIAVFADADLSDGMDDSTVMVVGR